MTSASVVLRVTCLVINQKSASKPVLQVARRLPSLFMDHFKNMGTLNM